MIKKESYFASLAGKHDSESDEDVILDMKYDPDFGTTIGVNDEAETRSSSLSLSLRHSSCTGTVHLSSNALPSWDCLTSRGSIQTFISDIVNSAEEERKNGNGADQGWTPSGDFSADDVSSQQESNKYLF